MKKSILTLFVLTLCTFYVYSQQSIRLIPGQSKINYLLKEDGGNSVVSQPIQVKVEFSGKEPETDQVLNFQIKNLSNAEIGFNPSITNTPIGGYFISKEKFHSKLDTASFTINININATKSLKASEFLDIYLKVEKNQSTVHRVVIENVSTKEAKLSERDSKFSIGAVSIGHSFDFFGKSNSLISYADAYIFEPNSFHIGKNVKDYKYGFALKLYQNKSITIDSLNRNGFSDKLINQSLLNPLQPPSSDSSILIKQEILSRKTSYTSSNWGMFIRLFRDISYTNDKMKFYLGVHGEFLRRDIKTNYEYKVEKDTIITTKFTNAILQSVTQLEKRTVQSEFYVSPYIEFLFADNNIQGHFSLFPIGLNIYRYSTFNNQTSSSLFFMGQFDLVVKKINIKVGAECRGQYNVRNQPYWNVFISKSFSWDKIAELIFDSN